MRPPKCCVLGTQSIIIADVVRRCKLDFAGVAHVVLPATAGRCARYHRLCLTAEATKTAGPNEGDLLPYDTEVLKTFNYVQFTLSGSGAVQFTLAESLPVQFTLSGAVQFTLAESLPVQFTLSGAVQFTLQMPTAASAAPATTNRIFCQVPTFITETLLFNSWY